jgi:hypothetical protein
VDRQAGCTAMQTSSLRDTRNEQQVDSTKASVPRC